jgi:hypothetical protein
MPALSIEEWKRVSKPQKGFSDMHELVQATVYGK